MKKEIKEIIHQFIADLVEAEVHFGEDGDETIDDIRTMGPDGDQYINMLDDVVNEIAEVKTGIEVLPRQIRDTLSDYLHTSKVRNADVGHGLELAIDIIQKNFIDLPDKKG